MDYTTKPVELPLSTEKEYVLVDVDGYTKTSANKQLISKHNLASPFKVERIDSDGWGLIGDDFVIITNHCLGIYDNEHGHFQEVIRNESDDTEWNGEGLPPVGAKCQYRDKTKWFDVEIKYLSEWYIVFVCLESNGSNLVDTNGVEICYSYVDFEKLTFRKPETEAERKERERLEAAYDLYCHAQQNKTLELNSFDEFIRGMNMRAQAWLAIVDKTNYRKDNHHE